MNQPPLSPPTHPDDRPEPDAPDTRQPEPSFADAPPTAHDQAASPERPDAERASGEGQADTQAKADEGPTGEARKAADVLPPPPRAPAMPPPLPTVGAPQPPPRFAAPPVRAPEPSPQPPPQPMPQPQPPTEQPYYYPPRIPAPQPAPPGGMIEPPRPYEGGRYVPPPPIPPSGPAFPNREWAPANTTITPLPPPTETRRGNPMMTALLGIIAALLLALTVFQGITTFHPKAAPPTGVQQVQVQKQAVKQTTAAEIKDTIDKAQTALNQFNQNVQNAYAGATTDAQRQAILFQSLILLQQIIAQQNNDLLLIYQDLYT
ncbi:MAG: hypothetical protein ACYDAR_20945 [Thermomicrobiales bacterium]